MKPFCSTLKDNNLVTFGDSTLDGVFLPEMTVSLVELELSMVFCRLGAWELDWVALPGPPVSRSGNNIVLRLIYTHANNGKFTLDSSAELIFLHILLD